jgi:AraC-like DNA-binding protein
MSRCANSALVFPMKYYDGVCITIDINKINTKLPEILKDAGVSGQNLYEKFCTPQKPFSLQNNKKVKQIFNDLYNSPENMKTAYYKLKVQELVIFLSSLDISEEKIINTHYDQQLKLIHEIHALLTQNLDQYFTIEELSKRYFLNTSALKETFKTVYGSPIASYMKEYRMKSAMELLRTTDYHISEIANNVGYQSQSKFTAAFKNITNILPSEYRKLNR